MLVVEDEYLVAALACDSFEDVGAHVTLASRGDEALAHLQETGCCDLLVTDIRMSGMDGWTLAEKARALCPGLPIVYMTGYSDVDERRVALSAFIRKPYRPQQLVELAASMLLAGASGNP